jgi:hypothetical protein
MKITRIASILMIFGLAVSAVHADVKTRQRTQLKFEGMLGRVMNMASGGAADGLTATVAVKGSRKADINNRTGRIVDLAEERVYELDVRRKEYRVVTFAELREQWKKAQADAEQAAKDMPADEREDLAQAGKEVEVTMDVKETGETKSIAGHQAKEVLVTITAQEKGKTLEEGGGMVMTNEVWVAPRVAALDEITQFDLKFFKAVYGDDVAATARQMASLVAMYPSLQELSSRMEERMRALDGTILSTTTKIETVKSAEAMKQSSAPPTGGLGGALARRLGAGRKPEARSLLVTSITETQQIAATASDADVAIPAGFKQKK